MAEKDLNCLLKMEIENQYFHPHMTLIGCSSQAWFWKIAQYIRNYTILLW